MLTFELSGQQYNKSAHRRALLQRLNGRSESSIEFKHRNISAVMQDLGYPPLRGYLAMYNYQRDVLTAAGINVVSLVPVGGFARGIAIGGIESTLYAAPEAAKEKA